ncbi:mucin-3B-like [Clupea harengus]|uniref:Mucin-3B-like n=1 Tax=Clupea harengus TaxID=7950 RepID=A0A6P8G9G3_CLUHA|nr:mucin-3B-like [Clupea harengus]
MTPIYNNTVKNFKEVVDITLNAATGGASRTRRTLFSGISVKDTTSNINAEHDIVVEVPNDKESEEALDETLKQVKETLDAVGKCSTPANNKDCPSFGVGEVEPPTPVAFDEDAFCRSKVEPGFEKYFSPVKVDGTLTCISPCEAAHPQPKGCQNDGTCEVLREGPTCYCRHTEQNWYLGSDCSYPVHKVGFYAGLGACAALLVASVGVLSACVIQKHRKQNRENDMKNELVNQWMEDDFEWPTSGRTSHTPSAGANANPAYQSGSLYTQQGLGLPGLQSRPAPGQMRARTDPHWAPIQQGPSYRTDPHWASPQQVPSYRTDPHWAPLQQGPSYRSAPPAYTGPSPVSLQYQAAPQIPLHHLHSVQPMWDRMPQLRLSVRSFDI